MNSDFDEIQGVIDQILLISMSEDNVPHCILSGSGHGWFWCPQTRQMKRVQRGTEIVYISDYGETKSLVMSSDSYLVVSKDDVIEVGYN